MSALKTCTALTLTAIIAGAGLLVGCGERSSAPAAVDAGPLPAQVQAWSLAAEPGLFVGEELFQLVNGGAELYHSFGFVQAWSAEYLTDAGGSISVEIYEMTDIDAARGIYETRVASGAGSEHPAIGEHATLESYYLSFRSGPYLVNLSGFDSDEETRAGLLLLGRSLAARLGEEHE